MSLRYDSFKKWTFKDKIRAIKKLHRLGKSNFEISGITGLEGTEVLQITRYLQRIGVLAYG